MKNKSEKIQVVQSCTIDYAFKRIGGKYKGRILWYLNEKNILRYGELSRALPDITTKMLTQTLREFEDDRLINRKVYHEVPPKVEYSLTETGQELIPFIDHLREWSLKEMGKKVMLILVKKSTNAQHWVLCKWGWTLYQSALVLYYTSVPAGQAIFNISSYFIKIFSISIGYGQDKHLFPTCTKS